MRILLAALLVAMTALVGAPARAADMPEYPDIEIPEVDYGLSGSFYLRGSAAGNFEWAREHVSTGGCVCLPPTAPGYGYSIGAGAPHSFSLIGPDWMKTTLRFVSSA